MDAIKNFALSQLASGITATQLTATVATGQGGRFPTTSDGPYNVVIYDASNYANAALAYQAGEAAIYRVLSRTGDILTFKDDGSSQREGQEGTGAIAHNTVGVTYVVMQALTAKILTDLDAKTGGVSSLIAGTGISLAPSSGLGDVTVTATGGGDSADIQDLLALLSINRYSETPVIAHESGALNLGDPYVVNIGGRLWIYYTQYVDGSGTNPIIVKREIIGDITNAASYGTKSTVLSLGTSGQWDDWGVRINGIIDNVGTYYMYYTGCKTSDGGNDKWHIGLATSTDGTTWTKYGSNPILSAHGSYTSVESAAVVKVESIWYMYYGYRTVSTILSGIIAASSSDGITWADSGEVLHIGATYDAGYIEHHQIVYYGNRYYLIYESSNSAQTSWTINIAYSTNPLGTFTKYVNNPVFSASGVGGSFDVSQVATPFVFSLNNKWYFFYQGGDGTHSYDSNWSIGIAYLKNGAVGATAGVSSIIAGPGISVDHGTGDVTITNTGGGGSAPAGFDGFTKLLLPMNSAEGFLDETGKTVSVVGSAAISTAQQKFDGSCGAFLADGAYLTVPDFPDLNLGTRDFTIDFWVRFNSLTTYIGLMDHYTDGSNKWSLMMGTSSGIIIFVDETGGSQTINAAFSWVPSLNTWYHVAFVRQGISNWYCFVNGSPLSVFGSIVGATESIATHVGVLSIGRIDNTNSEKLDGWMQELRIDVGKAMWTSAFTPPTAPY